MVRTEAVTVFYIRAPTCEGWFFGNSVAQHSIAGGLSGGINAAMNGGNIDMGVLTGGLSGGMGEYTGGFIPKDFGSQFVGRTAIGGITGGMTSELYGGSFSDGFLSGASTAGFGYLFNHMTHEGFKIWKGYQTSERWTQEATIRNQKIKDTLFPESELSKQEQINSYAKWYIDHSGLDGVPSVFASSAAVTVGGMAGALYEPLMISLGTPAGQRMVEFGQGYYEYWSAPTTGSGALGTFTSVYGPDWADPRTW